MNVVRATKPTSLVIVTQWVPPEQAPFGRMMAELSADLSSAGWDVTVVTGFPNHPSGTVFGGYSKRWCLKERVNGVTVVRMWLATSPRRTLVQRMLTFLSFTLTSAWAVLSQPRPSVMFAVLQPLSMGLTLPVLARLKGTPLVLNIQDLHPDTQIRLGLVRSGFLIHLLRRLEAYAYRAAACLTVISEPFRAHCIERGAVPARVELVPNWIDTDEIRPGPRDNPFRRSLGLSPEQFVVMWAGTLGHVSGAEIIVDVAAALAGDARIQFLLIGEGPLASVLRERSASAGLENLRILPFQPRSQLPAVQATADVSLVTLAAEFADTSVPSKVLAYLAAGRPVIAAVPEASETAATVRAAGAGRVVAAGDVAAIVDAIRMFSADPDAAAQCGDQGRRYVEQYHSRSSVTARYGELLSAIARG